MNTYKNRQFYYFLFFLIIAIVAFWQVALLQKPLKWDIIDCSYPWRFIISEHIQNFKLPLWNPYQSMGYPLFGDLQSGSTWYLPVWILGFLFGYNIYTISFEFIFHITLAGCGMFMLGQKLSLSNKASFLMGLTYMLSGLFVGNAQHLPYIVSATWLPFILSSYIELYRNGNFKDVVKSSFFIFLFISGGYAAYSLILGYFLVIIFVVFSVRIYKNKDRKTLYNFFLNNLYFLLIVLFLSCVIVFSVIDMSANITRTGGISIERAMFCPFSPQSSISFILPFAAIKDIEFFNTDLSMTNAYIGIITFVFLIYAFFIKKNKFIITVLIISFLSLLTAMGDAMPFRKILYDYVPFFNTFRFPSVFRLFTIMGFIITAAYSFNYFSKNIDKTKKILFIISSTIIVILIGIIAYARYSDYLQMKNFIFNYLFTASNETYFLQHLAFQSFVQILILSIFIGLIKFIKNTQVLLLSIISLFAIEIIVATQLNAPYTVYSKEFKQSEIYQHHKKYFVSGFPVLQDNNVSENTNKKLEHSPFWRNLTVFHKQISREGFTSLMLNNFETLLVDYPQLLNSTVNNPPFFITNNIFIEDSLLNHIKNNRLFSSNLYLNKNNYNSIKGKINVDNPIVYKIIIEEFKTDELLLSTSSNEDAVLVFVQNYYDGWKALLNNKEENLFIVNKGFMGLFVPKGENNVKLIFHKPLIIAGFYITVFSLFAVVIYFGVFIFRSSFIDLL